MIGFGDDVGLAVVFNGQLIMRKEGLQLAHFAADDEEQAKLIIGTFLEIWQSSPSYKGGVTSLPAFVLFLKANSCPNCLRGLCTVVGAKCEDGCTDPNECEAVIAELVLTLLPDAFADPEELELESELSPTPPPADDVYRWN